MPGLELRQRETVLESAGHLGVNCPRQPQVPGRGEQEVAEGD